MSLDAPPSEELVLLHSRLRDFGGAAEDLRMSIDECCSTSLQLDDAFVAEVDDNLQVILQWMRCHARVG